MDFDNNCIYRCKFNKKIRGNIFLLVKNTLKVINKHEIDINDKNDGTKNCRPPGLCRYVCVVNGDKATQTIIIAKSVKAIARRNFTSYLHN